MPIPSDPSTRPAAASSRREWTACTERPPRSVFGNYPAAPGAPAADASARRGPTHLLRADPSAGPRGEVAAPPAGLQRSIDLALARAWVYRFLAKAYEDPTAAGWCWLCDPATQGALRTALGTVAAAEPDGGALAARADALVAAFVPGAFETFHLACLSAFGHAARGQCPLNELEYGDLKADGLYQPHRLADIAAFYGAFGLEVSAGATERQDHLGMELEFLCVLAAKEAYALEHQLDPEELALGRAAQQTFLREHLGRWTPACARRLGAHAAGTPLEALAHLTRAFVESECGRFGVSAGSEDLLLRPADEATESLCATCSLAESTPESAAAL